MSEEEQNSEAQMVVEDGKRLSVRVPAGGPVLEGRRQRRVCASRVAPARGVRVRAARPEGAAEEQ